MHMVLKENSSAWNTLCSKNGVNFRSSSGVIKNKQFNLSIPLIFFNIYNFFQTFHGGRGGGGGDFSEEDNYCEQDIRGL